MARSKNGRWIYSIPKAIYVELHGSAPVGEAYLTRAECVKYGIGGKVIKFVPKTQERTYDGGPILRTRDKSHE